MYLLKSVLIFVGCICELRCEPLLAEHFKGLHLFEKLLIRYTHPKIHFDWSEFVDGDVYESSLLNLLQLEIPFAIGNLSLAKFGKDPPLEPVEFTTGYFTCPVNGSCHGIQQTYLAQGPLEIAATKVDFKSVLTPERFSLHFQLPSLDINNDKFSLIDKHLGTDVVVRRQGLQVFIRNYTITVEADCVEDAGARRGVKFVNSRVRFGVDEAKVVVGMDTTHQVTKSAVVPEVVFELSKDLNEHWATYGGRDAVVFESMLNAVLTNSSCDGACQVLEYNEWRAKALSHYLQMDKESHYHFHYHIPRLKLHTQLENTKTV